MASNFRYINGSSPYNTRDVSQSTAGSWLLKKKIKEMWIYYFELKRSTRSHCQHWKRLQQNLLQMHSFARQLLHVAGWQQRWGQCCSQLMWQLWQTSSLWPMTAWVSRKLMINDYMLGWFKKMGLVLYDWSEGTWTQKEGVERHRKWGSKKDETKGRRMSQMLNESICMKGSRPACSENALFCLSDLVKTNWTKSFRQHQTRFKKQF